VRKLRAQNKRNLRALQSHAVFTAYCELFVLNTSFLGAIPVHDIYICRPMAKITQNFDKSFICMSLHSFSKQRCELARVLLYPYL
jgi:hypothetical protein